MFLDILGAAVNVSGIVAIIYLIVIRIRIINNRRTMTYEQLANGYRKILITAILVMVLYLIGSLWFDRTTRMVAIARCIRLILILLLDVFLFRRWLKKQREEKQGSADAEE